MSKKIAVLPGRCYAVTASKDKDCAVMLDDGTTELLNVGGGTQDFVVAPRSVLIVSDDAARVTLASRNPAWLASRNPAWLASRNPAWLASLRSELDALSCAYKLAWMPVAGKLIVHTDRADDATLQIVSDLLDEVLPANIEVVRYNHNIEVSWRDINKYALCTNRADMLAINAGYENDLTSDGEWVYPLPEMINFGDIYPSYRGLFQSAKNLRKIKIVLPKARMIGYVFFNNPKLEEFDIEAPLVDNTSAAESCYHVVTGRLPSLKKARIAINRQYVDQILWGGTVNKLRFKLEILSGKKILSAALMVSYVAIDKESVLEIVDMLETYTSGSRPITLSIHIDYKNDEEVLAAIANAEAKGWTVSLQWNGTPTSTASTLSFGQLIYAKVGEMERPDGTTERYLNWGHYVTDTTGYETFRSLASAYEYFGLEMPAES